MVGIFSRFSGSKVGHRRAHSAIGNRELLPSNSGGAGTGSVSISTSHGIEIAVEFKPVEHPIEPLDNDRPIECPLPEPSILNDGRIWKERSQSIQRRAGDLPVMKGGETSESDSSVSKPRPSPGNRMMLPSLSAPEHNILNLLEDYNASRI